MPGHSTSNLTRIEGENKAAESDCLALEQSDTHTQSANQQRESSDQRLSSEQRAAS